MLDAQPESGKEQRENAPAHAVVEVVDEPGLRGREQIAVAEGGAPEKSARSEHLARRCGAGNLHADMAAGVAHQQQ
jgi:hypothetical protein